MSSTLVAQLVLFDREIKIGGSGWQKKKKQKILTRNDHNLGSRSPFDISTSALDRTLRDLSNGHSFRACTLPNNSVLDSEIPELRHFRK